jgi:hypothetical protein
MGLWWTVRNRQSAKRETIDDSLSLERASVPAEISRPARPSGVYVGSHVCAECHVPVAEQYGLTAMGRSLANVGGTSHEPEDYESNNSFQRGNREYRVEKVNGRVWHHEILADDEGVIFDQAEEIQYAIGSNTRGRSYVLWRDGAMFMSPISWYAKAGWDLSPAYLPDRHWRFNRRLTDACVICHSGRVARDDGRENYYPEPVFHEMSIGCERCHGPGEDHVNYRRQSSPDGRDPLVNLSQLAPPERDAVCYQCHFQGEERVLRLGREEDDFRPGMKFSDVWAVVMKGNGSDGDKTTAVSQAMQMQSSRCYQASQARLGCVSCHDPHESPAKENREGFFNQRCNKCHMNKDCSLPEVEQQAAPANGSCIHCHMPPLSASNIPHTSQTDHRIPRFARQSNSFKSLSDYAMFVEAGTNIPAIERVRAEGLMKWQLAEKQRDKNYANDSIRQLQAVLKVIPDDEAALQALGGALFLTGQTQSAESVSQDLNKRFPRNEMALFRLANASHDAHRYQEADSLFGRFVELNPWMPVTHGRWAHTLGMLNRYDQAFAEAERALKLDPTILPLYGWLSEAHALRGNTEKSRYYKHMAERLSKRLVPARNR